MVNPITIGYDNVRYLFDSGNCEIMTLYFPLDYATSKAAHTQAGVDYVVPSGKIAVVVSASICMGAAENAWIWDGSADSSSGTVKFRQKMPANTVMNIPLFLTFAAGNYINLQSNGGMTLVVIEVDT